jgi:2,4-dienoyl-CoA reductase-like NADH-dependent reductase (Old Yellow Enzyme family)
MNGLFDPLRLRGVTLRNRIGVAPMCQASCDDGLANDWHLVHLGARALGGAALVMVEATGVAPEARITHRDAGLWRDAQIEPLARIVRFVREAGAVPAIQLGHAGRKSSYASTWGPAGMQGLAALSPENGGWQVAGPGTSAFDARSAVPHAMSEAELAAVPGLFAAAARRADAAGFDWIEVHAAHGYLLHSFCSPISNRRSDRYGGAFENRVRLACDTARAVRDAWPARKVLAFRISHTDWIDGGWDTAQSVELACLLRDAGVDLIDVSSGGTSPTTTALARHHSEEGLRAHAAQRHDEVPPAVIPVAPGYQVPGAEAIRRGSGLPVAAVGLITDPHQADRIVREGRADMVMLARELLRDPNWPIRAALALGVAERMPVPCQYYLGWAELGPLRFEPVDPSRYCHPQGVAS